MSVVVSYPAVGFGDGVNGIFAASPTDAGIRDAFNAAVAAGGGTVKIPAGNISILSPLPMSHSVVYEGVLGSVWSVLDGTVLIGGGTGAYDCFALNTTPGSSPPPFDNTWVSNCGVRNLVIKNFNYGLHIGEYYAQGCVGGLFENIVTRDCNQGFWFENCSSGIFRNIYSNNCIKGVGTFAASAGNFGSGNSIYEFINANDGTASKITTRGVLLLARGASTPGNMQGMVSTYIQYNRTQAQTTSQAATMSNGSTTIGVVDATQFVVDQPVYFSPGGNGFQNLTIYFVASVNTGANTLSLANQPGGSAIAATGNAAATIVSSGFAPIEVIAYGSNSIGPISIRGLDLEGNGSCQAVISNAVGVDMEFMYSLIGNGLNTHVVRNSTSTTLRKTGDVTRTSGITLDTDTASLGTIINGSMTSGMGTGVLAQGVQQNNRSTTTYPRWKVNTLGITMIDQARYPSISINPGNNCLQVGGYGDNALGTFTAYLNSGTLDVGGGTPGYGRGNVIAVAGNITLGALPNSTSDGYIGMLINPTASAVTLTAAAGMNINGNAASFSLGAYTSCVVSVISKNLTGLATDTWLIK